MTVTLYKLSIIGILLVMLVGCSNKAEMQVAGETDNLQKDEQGKAKKPSALEVCKPEAGSPYYYRKVILVAGTTAAPDVARDLPGIANLISRRLQTHLDALERFNVRAEHEMSFESMASHTASQVSQFGRQHASQFVVKLELEDLTLGASGGWLSELFGDSAQRNVLIKLYIYDTEYGGLFHSQRYQGTVNGDVVGYPGTGTTVTTPWFSTNLGMKIDQMLEAMSAQINEKLACVPFSTDITAVKGNSIHINAGYLHGIRPGEALRVYRRSEIWAPDGTQKQEKRGSWIRINTVFPNHSIATPTEDKVGDYRPNVGDVVRPW